MTAVPFQRLQGLTNMLGLIIIIFLKKAFMNGLKWEEHIKI